MHVDHEAFLSLCVARGETVIHLDFGLASMDLPPFVRLALAFALSLHTWQGLVKLTDV
jgi:hypothetical protein